jgi:hypothetical protein
MRIRLILINGVAWSRGRLGSGPAAVALAVTLAGCGALPPQAPFPMAKKLDSSTSGISTDCGEADQVTAFSGHHASELAALDAKAAVSARKLAFVARQDPEWIYQGETVAEIVHAGVSDLRACHLPRSASLLVHASGASKR